MNGPRFRCKFHLCCCSHRPYGNVGGGHPAILKNTNVKARKTDNSLHVDRLGTQRALNICSRDGGYITCDHGGSEKSKTSGNIAGRNED